MDWWAWLILIAAIVLWTVVIVVLSFIFGKMQEQRSRERPIDFQRRPIEPERDGQVVAREGKGPIGHARVSTAHVSQQRRQWK